MGLKYNEDDYCDIYKKKICDNCGKCLEAEGVDIKAIKIEDIAKTVEENTILEEEYKNGLELESEEEAEELEDDLLEEEYAKLNEQGILNLAENEDYEDAFEHVVYLDEVDLLDDDALEEMTEEVFPGLRKIKKI